MVPPNEAMQGEITVDSQQGKGTTFTICLPVEPNEMAAEPTSGEVADARQEKPRVDGTPMVLVIDDDPTIQDLMKRHLVKSGFDVCVAATGEQGFLMAKQLRPDVITLDAVMPGMDGWSVLTALKDDQDTCDIPVVMVAMLEEHRSQAQRTGQPSRGSGGERALVGKTDY